MWGTLQELIDFFFKVVPYAGLDEDDAHTGDDLDVVITMSKEFLSDETRDQMLAAELRVIGKVARVLAPGETINLTRRTAIGATGPQFARSLVSEFSEGEGLHLDLDH